jgi:hypothetical protein
MIEITLHDSPATLAGKHGEDYVLLITEDLIPALAEMHARLRGHAVCGAVVPYLIADRRTIASGIACLTLPHGSSFAVVVPMTADAGAIDGALFDRDFASLLLFADGLSRHLDAFVSALEGPVQGRTVLGTGVGTKDFVPGPVVFDAAGIRADAALLVGTDLRLRAAARHGWESIHGPLVVTRAEGNVLYELNGEPAFAVYRRILSEQEGTGIRPDNFLAVAKSYPFGIASFKGSEILVRDPIRANPDGSLTVVSSVRRLDALYIMKGVRAQLLESSRALSRDTFAGGGFDQAFLFDCISRVQFLEEDFGRELDGVCDGAGAHGPRIFGVTSVGEITNAGHAGIKVLNKTTLLGAAEHV